MAAAAEQEAGQGFVLTNPLVFALEEVPALGKEDTSGQVPYRYPRGQSVRCGPARSSEVKKYPELKSKRPLYGSVKFGGSPLEPMSGTTFHFVLDETGEAEKKPADGGGAEAKTPADTPKAAGKAERSKPSQSRSLARSAASDPLDSFALPVSQQTYDLLYFDRNGDFDLTNDGVIRLDAKPVFEALPGRPSHGLSGEMELAFDFGPAVGQRPFPIAVAALAYQGTAFVSFLPKTARRGKVTLGEEQYVAVLSQATMITGRYDRPSTRLELMRVDRPATTMLLQPGSLGQIHWVGEQLVSVSASPLGDTLTIAPYRGDTGSLEIGPGGRAITELGLGGQLTSRTGTTTTLGSTPRGLSLPESLPRRYTLPVGEYGLPTMTVQHGRLRFNARTVPVRASGSASPSAKTPMFPIQIRKDQRFVLEFSGKPEVVFMNPAKDNSFRPGDKVAVRAMLTEPWQGFQITGLWDMTRKQGETRYRLEGREVVIPQYARLDPTIAIKNPAGEVVAEGKMPFG
jgi:hypothetical protein